MVTIVWNDVCVVAALPVTALAYVACCGGWWVLLCLWTKAEYLFVLLFLCVLSALQDKL
jgi:hypothetical protein